MNSIDKFIPTNDKDLFTLVGSETNNQIERITSAPYSYWKSSFKQLIKNRVAILCMVLIFLVLFLTIFGPMMQYYDPFADITNLSKYELPSINHWFGTDQNGYDIWTNIWVGSRLSLLLAVVVAFINTALGLIIGALWGFFRRLDPIMIEIRNFINNVPSLLIDILLLQFFSTMENPIPSFWSLVIVLCMFGWMGLASSLRNQIIIIRNRDFNIASKTLGSKPSSIMMHNLLPNLISIIVTIICTAIPDVISSEVSLSFFGLGFKRSQNVITLGMVLINSTSGASADWLGHPHIMLFPAMVILILNIAFFYLGIVFSDAVDPRNHR